MQFYRLADYESDYNINNVMVLIQHTEIFKNELMPHCHDFYEITLVEEGNSIHCINDRIVPISRAQLTFIRPADRHCYMSYKSENYTMFNIRISEDDYLKIKDFLNGQTASLEEPELPVSIRLSEPKLTAIAAKLRAINDMPTSEKRGAEVKTVICEIFMELLGADPHKQPMPEWFSKILEELTHDFTSETDLSALSKRYGVSREHMCRSFRKYLNVTPSQYINALRLCEAARLLSGTDQEIIEISNEVGFNNLGYFYRLFSDYFKVSPREYRLRCQKNLNCEGNGYGKRIFQ